MGQIVKKIKVMLLGSAGMAGHVLKCELQKISDIIELVDVARSSELIRPKIEMDVTDFMVLRKIINEGDFDFIINCVGILNAFAEDNPDQAILVNAYFPHFLERITKSSNLRIIHLSTDCVFSGSKGDYIETDPKDGDGFYGQSKALGELDNDKDLTIRTSIIGPDLNQDGIGLFNWIINQEGVINGFSKAYWSGVTTIQLAKSIIKFILQNDPPSGVVHLTNNEKISKYELLKIIQQVFKLAHVKVVESKEHKTDKSIVNTRKELQLKIPPYHQMIMEMKKWMVSQ